MLDAQHDALIDALEWAFPQTREKETLMSGNLKFTASSLCQASHVHSVTLHVRHLRKVGFRISGGKM